MAENNNQNQEEMNSESLAAEDPEFGKVDPEESVETPEESPVYEMGGGKELDTTEIDSWKQLLQDKTVIASITAVVLAILLVGALVFYFVFWRNTPVPPAPNVNLQAEIPEKIVAGKPFDIKIIYTNDSPNRIEDVRIILDYPLDYNFNESQPDPVSNAGQRFDLGNLPAGESGSVTIIGALDGSIGDSKELNLQLRYKLPGVNQDYILKKQIPLVIGSSDVSLNILGPTEVTAGQEIIYNVIYENVTDEIIRGVSLSFVIPQEFQILSSEPKINDNNVVVLGDLSPGQKGSIKLEGVYPEASSFQRIIEVTVMTTEKGILTRDFTITFINDSPIILTQSISPDSAVDPGDTLNYKLRLHNKSNQTLSNLIVSTDLEGEAYNFSSLEARGGVLSGRTITWTAGGVSELRSLAPNQRIEIPFQIKVSNPATNRGVQSIALSSNPKVTSFELTDPILGQISKVRVITTTDLTQNITYQSGANPPQVGEETRYRIDWNLKNTTNTIGDVRISANLPRGQQSFVRAETATGIIGLNNLTSEVVWDLGTLGAHNIANAYIIISYTPSVADVGSSPVLLNNISLIGKDMFTNEAISAQISEARAKDSVRN